MPPGNKEEDDMFRTKRLNDPMEQPYCVKYGPRGGRRSTTNVNTLVNFSFLRPRECSSIRKEWNPSSTLIKKMLSTIADNDLSDSDDQ